MLRKELLRRLSSQSNATRCSRTSALVVHQGVSASNCCVAFHTTRVNLIPIPPQLIRVLTVGGLFLIDAFLRAHRQQVRKMAQEENTSSEATSSATESASPTAMSSGEALQVLGLSANLSVPLKDPSDIAQAKKNFKLCFQKAQAAGSPYLQGKFSAAYRLCVDDKWDAAASESQEDPPRRE